MRSVLKVSGMKLKRGLLIAEESIESKCPQMTTDKTPLTILSTSKVTTNYQK